MKTKFIYIGGDVPGMAHCECVPSTYGQRIHKSGDHVAVSFNSVDRYWVNTNDLVKCLLNDEVNDMNAILDYIRENIKTWPDGARTVHIDKDGEIVFNNDPRHTVDYFTRTQWEKTVNWDECSDELAAVVVVNGEQNYYRLHNGELQIYLFTDNWVKSCYTLDMLMNDSLFHGVAHVRPSLLSTDLTKIDTVFNTLSKETKLKILEHIIDGGKIEIYCTYLEKWTQVEFAYDHINSKIRAVK